MLNDARSRMLGSSDFVAQYNLSFDAHYHLATIHPWADGNGRMARLVMNMLQFEFRLVPVKVMRDDKAEYIQALVDSRSAESLEPFRLFMQREHISNLQRELAEYKKSQELDPINGSIDPINAKVDLINLMSDPINARLCEAIVRDSGGSYAAYAAQLGTSEATIKRRIAKLKKEGVITRVGSKKTGHWQVHNVTEGSAEI